MGENRSAADPDPYRELFERSGDAILIIEDERFVDCNDATVAMLRCKDKQDLLRTHPSDLSPPTQPDGRDSFEKANEMMALALAHGSHRFEWDHLRFDGEVFPVEVLLTAVRRDGRTILHVVWRDITDRRRLEEQLHHAQKLEVIGQLTGGIAHDFNNLLVAIMANGELLQRRLTDRPDLAVFVEEMVKAGRRGAALVRQLLLFSRPPEGPADVIDVVPVLRDVQRMLERLIGEDIELTVECASESLPIRSRHGHIEQVIVNLVTNARDAMPGGGKLAIVLDAVTITEDSVGAVEQLARGTYAVLSVTDSGLGMTEEVRAHAIEPFFTTKEVGRGTGLGLSTVYGIAKQSGGGLRIDSTPGHGTTVKVFLPLRQGDVPTEAPVAARGSRGGTEHILVAEDDEIVAKVVVRLLSAQGYRVDLARNGKEALDLCLARREELALLVTDVVMPHLSGPDLVSALRERGVSIPVLFMSGYTRNAILPSAGDDSAIELLEKPFSGSDLVARVREILDRHAGVSSSR